MFFGAAVQADAYHNKLNTSFDHDWVTPGLFVTADRDIGPVTVSASVRGDHHPEAGLELTERLAILARPADEWSVRVSGGTGFAAPASMTEEVEAIGLRAIQPSTLRAERSVGAMIDVNGRVLGAEFLLTGYGSSIERAIQLVDLGDPHCQERCAMRRALPESVAPKRAAIWRFGGDNKFLLTYGYARGTQTDAETGRREPVPLLNRHRVGADLMLEKPGVYRVGIEGIYYGRQVLDDNPYRQPVETVRLRDGDRDAAIRASGGRRQLREPARRAADGLPPAGSARSHRRRPLDHRCLGSARRLHGQRSGALPMAARHQLRSQQTLCRIMI